MFSAINLMHLSMGTLPEGCTMHLKTHVIHPATYINKGVVGLAYLHFTKLTSNFYLFTYFVTNLQMCLAILDFLYFFKMLMLVGWLASWLAG